MGKPDCGTLCPPPHGAEAWSVLGKVLDRSSSFVVFVLLGTLTVDDEINKAFSFTAGVTRQWVMRTHAYGLANPQ